MIERSARSFVEHDMSTYSAALAFRMLLSLIPFALFVVALLNVLGASDLFGWLLLRAQLALEQDYPALATLFLENEQETGTGLLVSGVVIAFWSVSAGARSLIKALNTVNEVEESRTPVRRFMISAISAPALAFGLLLASSLLLVGPQAIEWIAALVWLDAVFVALWTLLRIPVALVILVPVISLIYYAAPNSPHQPFRLITPGAALSVAVWAAASLGFSYYAGNFATYSAFGGLGSAVLLLLYFYISAAVLLLGAELNAACYRKPRVR